MNVMECRLPDDVGKALRQRDRVYKPGHALFLDPSDQSALRASPEPSPLDQMGLTTDRGESELFRPPFHWRKDVRIELESMESTKLHSDEGDQLTPSSASWNQHPELQVSWQNAPSSNVVG